ncbi:hypothetical protein NliqN6_0153 [Naganishia liquefaciens]|uniref:Acetoacetate decarboxylase n=1 Tax=Naganishia liquefaciens TaxID=104408 RepID=A0A8H3TN39_9TREE|nr:hypothetical protein NliqN6_0153 [Naganishia liquefaciens]
MFEDTGLYHRQPVGFGPASGPRQGPDGKRFTTWGESEVHLTSIVYDCERASLQALLPTGYEIDTEISQPTVLFEAMNLRNLPWLAGRGYNTFGVYANDVVCKNSKEPVKASYLLVLFENCCDPIITGREELGFPKVWAELPDPITEDGKLIHTASWLGTEFIKLSVPNIEERPIEESPSMFKRPYTMPTVEGLLHHRYVPSVGEPGKHDASYPIFVPGAGDRKPPITRFATMSESTVQDCRLEITRHPWERLPTIGNIVDGLANLQLGKVREFAHQTIAGAGDVAGTRRI